MKSRVRWYVVLVLLFTGLATAVLWWQAVRSQALLREQVLLQARERSLHVASSMAGQIQAQLGLLDMALLQLRARWQPGETAGFDALAREALSSLPPGFVSHLTVVNAAGVSVFNTVGLPTGNYVGARGYFVALRSGVDRLVVSDPVVSRLTGRWSFVVSRPLRRDGRFEGVVSVVVQSAYVAQRLGSLQLSDLDVVSLINADGRFLARSRDNDASMEVVVPTDRPFRLDTRQTQGSYRADDALDHAPRTYGWYRLADTGLVLSVGLADDTVLAPLAPALQRGVLVTALWSLLLLVSGGVIARGQWRAARSQEALRRRESELNEAQRLAHIGSWAYDLGTGVVTWSDEVYRIFEVDPVQIQPSFERFIGWVHPEDRAGVELAFKASLREGRPYDVVHRLLLADGRVKYLREMGATVSEGERVLSCRGTVQDVTEVREAQLALQRLNDRLETRVSERTSELAQSVGALEAFSYSVSHDLRTPLRSIHGFACVLEEEEAMALSDAGRRHLRRIQDGSRRMGQLITDLLSLAQLNRTPMRPVPVDLSGLARAVADELQGTEPGRVVDWQIAEGLRAMADPELTRVVLCNLMGNAWKYTGQTPNAWIQLTQAQMPDGRTEFCVRDNGAGFDMAFVEQLFQPFKRLHAHHEFEGSGVGLATVSQVIRRHGGTVRAQGAVGQGAAFYFSLTEVPGTAFTNVTAPGPARP